MTFRFARHTNDLKKIEDFYVDILGIELLGGFEKHNNYDGIFIGKSGLDWHFEFTQSNAKANHSIGFCSKSILQRLVNAGFLYEIEIKLRLQRMFT